MLIRKIKDWRNKTIEDCSDKKEMGVEILPEKELMDKKGKNYYLKRNFRKCIPLSLNNDELNACFSNEKSISDDKAKIIEPFLNCFKENYFESSESCFIPPNTELFLGENSGSYGDNAYFFNCDFERDDNWNILISENNLKNLTLTPNDVEVIDKIFEYPYNKIVSFKEGCFSFTYGFDIVNLYVKNCKDFFDANSLIEIFKPLMLSEYYDNQEELHIYCEDVGNHNFIVDLRDWENCSIKKFVSRDFNTIDKEIKNYMKPNGLER